MNKLVVTVALACAAGAASAQNLLTNPGFEDGLNGWFAFGNAFPETNNPPQFEAHEGEGLVSMFGNFNGSFNVTGIFQEFAAAPGQTWEMDAFSRHFSGDAMVGGGAATNDNWVVMKIAFKDAGDNEIGAVERTILDGTFATDVWHDHDPITGVAPSGTAQVEAFILYLQPEFDGGAAHIDSVSLVPAPGALALLALAGATTRRSRRAR